MSRNFCETVALKYQIQVLEVVTVHKHDGSVRTYD